MERRAGVPHRGSAPHRRGEGPGRADRRSVRPLEGAAADYAKVIQRKADRLKHMVQDVFDLSALREVMDGLASGSIKMSEVRTAAPSP